MTRTILNQVFLLTIHSTYTTMKTLSYFIFFLMVFTVAKSQSTGDFQSEKLELLWEVKGLSTPESVLPIVSEGILYVSNIGSKDPTAKEKQGFISIINADGTIKNLHWITGLNSPKGMAVVHEMLYVTEVDKITEIDILKGKVLNSYPVENAEFLNDIIADKEGNLFVSDSKNGSVYKLSDGKVQLFLKSDISKGANGLNYDGISILLGTADKIIKIYPHSGLTEEYLTNTGGVDGLQLLSIDKVIFSNWEGKVFLMSKGSEKELLLDTSKEKASQTADFGYDEESDLIYIPTFFTNSVVCYRFKE
jgi:hypothetical protein